MFALSGVMFRALTALTAILCAVGLICMIILMGPTWLLWPLLSKEQRSDLQRLVTAWTKWVGTLITARSAPKKPSSG